VNLAISGSAMVIMLVNTPKISFQNVKDQENVMLEVIIMEMENKKC
jgi:hypothetical protein